ncbi:MAG: hypothetical protein CFE32_16975 [Alphaproteobacteria bacterium PA3]|nr:MAG: hypothetical protein CFE32_16975 [Alphaproteobacteria bacterium PA3]
MGTIEAALRDNAYSPIDILTVGEAMLEFAASDRGREGWQLRVGGDTINVATYLARLGWNV